MCDLVSWATEVFFVRRDVCLLMGSVVWMNGGMDEWVCYFDTMIMSRKKLLSRFVSKLGSWRLRQVFWNLWLRGNGI